MRDLLISALEYLAMLIATILVMSIPAMAATTQDRNTATVEGVILDSGTDVPLSGVSLRIASRGPRVVTDELGRFAFELEPGEHLLTGEKPGYMNLRPPDRKIPGNSGVPVRLGAGDRSTWMLRMYRSPIVRGRVVDDRGHPLQDVRVVPYRNVYDLTGRSNPKYFASQKTNDLGEFRFTDLDAGEYRFRIEPPIVAGPRPDSAMFAVGYYPGVLDSRDATSADAKSGSETSLGDIVLRTTKGRLVSLRITNSGGAPVPGPASANVKRRGESSRATLLVSINSTRQEVGRFAPGLYDVEAAVSSLAGRLSGSQLVEVRDEGGVLDVDIVVQESVKVKGSVRVFPKSDGPSRPVQGIDVRLVKRNAVLDLPSVFTSAADGTLSGFGPSLISSSAYDIEIARVPPTLYVSSVTESGREVQRTGVLIEGNQELTIEVTLKETNSIIQGIVKNAEDKIVEGAIVVLLPDKPEEMLPLTAKTNEKGEFQIACDSGQYHISAWGELEGAAYLDGAFLARHRVLGQAVDTTLESRLQTVLKLMN